MCVKLFLDLDVLLAQISRLRSILTDILVSKIIKKNYQELKAVSVPCQSLRTHNNGKDFNCGTD